MRRRFTLTATAETLKKTFALPNVPKNLAPRFNIAPTQPVVVAGSFAPTEQTPATLRPLLAPFPADEMAFYPVSIMVNAPANDYPACIEPLKGVRV